VVNLRHSGDNGMSGDNGGNGDNGRQRPGRIREGLTNRGIRAAALPSAGQHIVRDAEVRGLGVRLTKESRTFVLEYRTISGTRRRLTLGEFGRLTLEQARTLAREFLADVARGADPAARRQAAREAPDVAAVAASYLAKHLRPTRKASTVREFERVISRDILPTFGRRRVADVLAPEVATWHQRIGKEAPIHANRALAILRAMFRHAERQGLREPNTDPTRYVSKFPETKRDRFLSAEEVGRLGAELAASEGREHPSAILAIRLLTLTGARRSEVVGLRWSDVDFERSLLTLADSKTGRKVIPLGAPALALLEAARSTRRPGARFVCAGRTDRPFAALGKAWERIRSRAGLDQVRLHDLRHSYASTGAAAGLGLFIVGRILGHADAKTTQRYAHLADDPVRAATERIAGEIAAKLSGAAVREAVPIGRRRVVR
jgi:integrase